jgi:hypothetical protein
MAGSNEVNLNESKVFSFISCPVLSSWRTFFHVFVFFFFQSLELYMIVWSIGLFHFINFFFFFSGFGLFGFGKLEFREFEFHLGLLGTV